MGRLSVRLTTAAGDRGAPHQSHAANRRGICKARSAGLSTIMSRYGAARAIERIAKYARWLIARTISRGRSSRRFPGMEVLVLPRGADPAMTNRRLSSWAVRSLIVGVAALWFPACGPTEGGGGSGGSSPGTGVGGSAGAGSGGSAGGATGGSTAGTGALSGDAGAGGMAVAGTSGASAGNGGGRGGQAGGDTGGNAAGTVGRAGGGGAAGTGGVGTGGGSAGTGGAVGGRGGGAGGAGGGGGSRGGAGGAAGACQRGQVAADEVLIIGDSYFPAAGGEIVKELRRLSGANYRDRSVGGAKMAAIINQYDTAPAPQPKVLIMDGGGNDILQNPGCAPGCAQEMQAVTQARDFFRQAQTDGVQHIVFIFYYDMPVMKAGLDWMRPMMAAECQQSPVPCHFVDNQPLFAGMDASTFTSDGIHPTAAAADIIAGQTWSIMQRDCVAQ